MRQYEYETKEREVHEQRALATNDFFFAAETVPNNEVFSLSEHYV